jgi:hypothetical protein
MGAVPSLICGDPNLIAADQPFVKKVLEWVEASGS